jgi:CubicO group peptidase (beta-lactamase class C family)
VVHETYYEGDAASKYHTFSITKGFGATLIGIAQTKGLLDVKDKVSDWLSVHHPDIKAGATIKLDLSRKSAGYLYHLRGHPFKRERAFAS